jgi:hypothetical protein
MSSASGNSSRRTMAKRKKLPKLTPEELAHREETRRMLEERIAYHDAKAREEEREQRGPTRS